MKCQSPFSRKKYETKQNTVSLSSAELDHRVVKVNKLLSCYQYLRTVNVYSPLVSQIIHTGVCILHVYGTTYRLINNLINQSLKDAGAQ